MISYIIFGIYFCLVLVGANMFSKNIKKEEKEEEAMNVVLMLFLFTTGDASAPYFDIPVYVENTVNFREIERLAKEPCDEENYEDTVKRVLDSTSTKIWWQFFDKNANVNITGVNYILV